MSLDLRKIDSALSSELCVAILNVVGLDEKNVGEVLSDLQTKGLSLKYRETVYRALERLVDARLLEKKYVQDKGICYKLKKREITIHLLDGKVE